jgi:hypothetical protein
VPLSGLPRVEEGPRGDVLPVCGASPYLGREWVFADMSIRLCPVGLGFCSPVCADQNGQARSVWIGTLEMP